MKTRIHPNRESAVALIIVLAMLVLLSGLIVSFMTAVGNERAASIVSNNELTSRQIADSTVNLVITQIRQATSLTGDKSAPTTWASQPGAIRTFSGGVSGSKRVNNGAGGVNQATYTGGKNDFVFKLYSAENMKVQSSSFGNSPWDATEVKMIQDWDWKDSEKGREDKGFRGYVDLNEPIVTPMPEELTKGDRTIVEPRYPIVDPRAKYDVDEKANTSEEPGIVEGFDMKTSLRNNKLNFLPKGVDGKRKTGSASSVPYLPMPVKWLYVMRDGSMAAAEDKNGGKIPGASENNPIIGRTAFWTDDDSARLNINTASEGTFWDTPTGSSEQESGNIANDGSLTGSKGGLYFSSAQPARGEYQRYPGHPATTCLSPALGWMWEIMPNHYPRQTLDTKLITMKDAIAQMTPYMPWGKKGSLGGSNPPQSTSMGASYNAARDAISLSPDTAKVDEKDPKLAIGTKHLYSTVDELVYKQERVQLDTSKPTDLNSPKLLPESLEKVRFFLTANSRAPELNLFGRPRVTFWPVNADPKQRTSYDDLFAFTSTFYKDVNDSSGARDNAFYFTRSNAKNPYTDFNSKNKLMMDYLKALTSKELGIPGFGGSFEEKYTRVETDEILTLIFDYCRCVNLVDTSTRIREGEAFRPYTPFYYDPKLDAKAYNTYAPRSVDWSGQVVPLRINATGKYQGMGRAPLISEAAIVISKVGAGGKQLQATLLFEMATVMAGFPVLRDTYWMRMEVTRRTTINGNDIRLGGSEREKRYNVVNVGSHDVGFGRSYLPLLGFMNQLHYFPEPAKATLDTNTTVFQLGQAKGKSFTPHQSTFDDGHKYERNTTIKYYPFVSDPIPVPGDGNIAFSAGSFRVEMIAGEAPDDIQPGRNEIFHTFEIDFPSQTVQLKVPAGTTDTTFTNRLDGTEGRWSDSIVGSDIVRSMEYVGAKENPDGSFTTLEGDQQGDLRLAAARRVVPKEAYAPRGGTAAYLSAVQALHGLQVGHGETYTNYSGTKGYFAASGATAFRPTKPPMLPGNIKGVKRSDGGPGDWDRGLSKHMDGAMGNKVDEGNVFFNIGDTGGGRVPYFRGRAIEETGKSFFSPNRQLSSAVMFGSLPTGAARGLPWQTLLFRPDRGKSHPGAQQVRMPADHLILDLFNLPIVEPYAISEPFSTGGKVNLNYVIAPFGYAEGDKGSKRKGVNMPRSYIRRDTALRGVLKSVKIMAVPGNEPEGGHTEDPTGQTSRVYRFDIDAERTLDQFEDRFKDPDRGLFRSASEICDMDLYPFDPIKTAQIVAPSSTKPPIPNAVSDWGTFWDSDYAMTGDNMRERPYSHIYPRVTTKSNVFTIYMRCQAVKKTAGTAPDKFDPTKDKVIGAYRGSATIERFIDPNDEELKGYNPTDTLSNADRFYRFRVLNTKQFLPR